jgi:hypothetical protein
LNIGQASREWSIPNTKDRETFPGTGVDPENHSTAEAILWAIPEKLGNSLIKNEEVLPHSLG